MTPVAIVVHVGAGAIALISGVVAVSCLKGGPAHRASGAVFVISMLVMAALADYLAVTIPDRLPNLFIDTFAIYLVATALFVITFMLAMAAIGDARAVLVGGLSGAKLIGRHLWRMCLGLTFAAGSAFTNGFPRLLPPGVHIPLLWLFVPQLTALALMVFWIIRVRFTGWYHALSPVTTHASTCSPHQPLRTAIPGRASLPP